MTGGLNEIDYPETICYNSEEEIRKRLTLVFEKRKSIPVKKRDMKKAFGQYTLELILLQMKLRLVCGLEGEIKKRRLREASRERLRERKFLIDELSRHSNSNNKHMIRFVKHYKSCH